MRTGFATEHWSVVDTVAIGAVTVLAGAMRFAGITHPARFVFDEHYASDACLYVLGTQPPCLTTTETNFMHPPLGKWLIGAGIRLFGFDPGGWRVAPLVAGTLSVALLYLLARRLLKSTIAASVAAGLLAFDFLHFVMSRIAMLDIFVVFFGLACFLFFLYDSDGGDEKALRSGNLLRRLVNRPWLLGAGIAGGAAVACKWSGGYLLAAVFALAVARQATIGSGRRLRLLAEESVLLVIALVLVPSIVYVVCYTGRLEGALLAWPWAEGSWTRAFVLRHQLMLEHHTGSLYVHPYMSPAWSWLLVKRPVLLHFRDLGAGYQEILGFGNPLVWWPSLLALGATTWRVLRRRSIWSPETIILAGFAAGYVPWLVITRQEAFLYYVLPAVPFLYLAIGSVVAGFSTRPIKIAAISGLMIASLGAFSFFRPVLMGAPLSHQQWERRMIFSNCGPALSGSHKRPVNRPIPPPAGWCWV
jgi:dolichyl-phosphate-mannose--protein O-mannosyl transferase